MKSSYDLNNERVIALFLLFALSIGAIIIRFLITPPNLIVQQVLFYFGFLGYSVVIISILYYYIVKANDWVNQNENRTIIFVAILLALCHSLFIGIDHKSWLAFFGYLMGDGLIILIGFFTYKKWRKNKIVEKK